MGAPAVGRHRHIRHIENGVAIGMLELVIDSPALLTARHAPAPSQVGQEIRRMELLPAKRSAQVRDTLLATAQLFQDAQPAGVVQASKPIRQVLERIELRAVLDENFTASAD